MSYDSIEEDDKEMEDIPEDGCNCTKGKLIQLQSNEKLLQISLLHSNESFYIIVNANSEIDRDVYVIVDCQYGRDIAVVNGEILSTNSVPEKMILNLIRPANEQDMKNYEQNLGNEKKAFKTCRELIVKNNLEMKLVSAHYLLDEPKIIFFFTADNRVDFRELVKDLVAVFKVRIELRQIGIRDESRILGGCAVCGRDFCCHGVSDHLKPVSIKMAKEQNLSLNSMKISGPCGRLLCCLSYEYDFYKQERKLFPSVGTQVNQDTLKYKVVEINIISHTVRLVGPDDQNLILPLKNLKFLTRQKKWIINQVPVDKAEAPEIDTIEVKNFQNKTIDQSENKQNPHFQNKNQDRNKNNDRNNDRNNDHARQPHPHHHHKKNK